MGYTLKQPCKNTTLLTTSDDACLFKELLLGIFILARGAAIDLIMIIIIIKSMGGTYKKMVYLIDEA